VGLIFQKEVTERLGLDISKRSDRKTGAQYFKKVTERLGLNI